MRTTCVVQDALTSGLHLKTAMRHSRMDMTLYYSHSRRSAKRAAQEKVVERLVLPAAASEMRVPMRKPETIQ